VNEIISSLGDLGKFFHYEFSEPQNIFILGTTANNLCPNVRIVGYLGRSHYAVGCSSINVEQVRYGSDHYVVGLTEDDRQLAKLRQLVLA
jgi:hypothetical protein